MNLLPQILVNGLIAGSLIALIALGLNLIYGNLKFMNFAHGEMAMLGAYFYYFFYVYLLWPTLPSMVVAVLLCGLAGLLFNRVIFSPMRKESQWTLLIISVGVGMTLKFSTQLVAGSQARNFVRGSYDPQVFHLLEDRIIITVNQIVILVATALILLGLIAFMKYSRLGKAIRAVSDNAELASVVGIRVGRTIDWVFIISSALAGFAGILTAYEQSLTPNVGQVLSILAFAACIMGGLGSLRGAVLGGFLLGILQNLVVGVNIGGFEIPTSYKSLVAFALLIFFLLLRPRGLFGISLEEDKTSKA
jgi:branched-chain amino acid transport system permease protein